MIHLVIAPTPFDRGELQPGLHDLTLAEAESAYVRGTARPATAAEIAGATQRLSEFHSAENIEPTETERAAAPALVERATIRRRASAPAVSA